MTQGVAFLACGCLGAFVVWFLLGFIAFMLACPGTRGLYEVDINVGWARLRLFGAVAWLPALLTATAFWLFPKSETLWESRGATVVCVLLAYWFVYRLHRRLS